MAVHTIIDLIMNWITIPLLADNMWLAWGSMRLAILFDDIMYQVIFDFQFARMLPYKPMEEEGTPDDQVTFGGHVEPSRPVVISPGPGLQAPNQVSGITHGLNSSTVPWFPLWITCTSIWHSSLSLQWRHNGRDGVSNHQCLPNCLFWRRSKKTSKLRVTDLCEGNSPMTGEFPAQMASNAENVSIWWRHHELEASCLWTFHKNSFDDWLPVDSIYGYPIVKWVILTVGW